MKGVESGVGMGRIVGGLREGFKWLYPRFIVTSSVKGMREVGVRFQLFCVTQQSSKPRTTVLNG